MSRPPDTVLKLSKTISLCGFNTGGDKGFWLYDKTRGTNLAMRAETEQAAFVEALEYYQKRTAAVETELRIIEEKVDKIIALVCPLEDDHDDY